MNEEGDITLCRWRTCTCDSGYIDRDRGYTCDYCNGDGGAWIPMTRITLKEKR